MIKNALRVFFACCLLIIFSAIWGACRFFDWLFSSLRPHPVNHELDALQAANERERE